MTQYSIICRTDMGDYYNDDIFIVFSESENLAIAEAKNKYPNCDIYFAN
jgi:hypothetical protein